MEHAFAGKRASGINAVDSTYQTTVMPGFCAMRMTQTVELDVRRFHFRRNPSSLLPDTRNLRAQSNDFSERMIDRERPTLARRVPPGITKALRNVQAVELQNPARVRAE